MTVQLPAATSCASPIQRDTKANTQAAQKDATATVYSMIRGCFIRCSFSELILGDFLVFQQFDHLPWKFMGD